MPLLDHFRPPVAEDIPWNSFHAVWAGSLADQLTAVVPGEYKVREHLKLGGGLEVDVAATRRAAGAAGPSEWWSAWQPPAAAAASAAVFPDRFGVLVYRQPGGRQLVAAVVLVSPGNKDGEDTREAFTAEVVGYLHEEVSVVLIDVVTERRANLHNRIADRLGFPAEVRLPRGGLYAAAYRPVVRDGRPEFDIWTATFAVGDPLPTMPLRLIADYFVPVDFGAAYTAARERRRV
jgi:hypothetical protein